MAQANVIQGHFPGNGPRFVAHAAPGAVQPKAAGSPGWVQAAIARGGGAQPPAHSAAQAKSVSRTIPLPPHAPQHSNAIQLPSQLTSFARGGGHPLPAPVRQRLEQAVGANLSDVRVHVGSQAASIGATAFTYGNHVYFAPRQFSPYALGRELAHVVQQRSGRVHNPFGSGVAVVQDRALGAEAARVGRQVARTIQRITDSEARRDLDRDLIDAYELWRNQMQEYGGSDSSFVTNVLRTVDSVRELEHILHGDQAHRNARASEKTVEELAREGMVLIERSSLTRAYASRLTQRLDTLRVMTRTEFERNYLELVAQENPQAVPGRAKALGNLEGYEIHGISHVRAEGTQMHHVVHELVHAMTTSGLKGVWGQLACEGATELITLRVMQDNGIVVAGPGYPDERYDLREFMTKAHLDLEALAQVYFANTDAFRPLVFRTLGDEVGAGFLVDCTAYDNAKRTAQTNVLVQNSVSFKPTRTTARTPLLAPQTASGSSSSNCCLCFLTTACIEAKGLPDDCHELTVLRAFRDTHVASLPDGVPLIAEYYRIAPAIVAAMQARRDAAALFRELYESLVAPCVALIEAGSVAEAMTNYRGHVERLKERYGVT
jgi:hypothetical protein